MLKFMLIIDIIDLNESFVLEDITNANHVFVLFILNCIFKDHLKAF